MHLATQLYLLANHGHLDIKLHCEFTDSELIFMWVVITEYHLHVLKRLALHRNKQKE